MAQWRLVGRPLREPEERLVMRLDGQLDSVVAVWVEGGLVTGIYTVRNLQKLSRVERETALRR